MSSPTAEKTEQPSPVSMRERKRQLVREQVAAAAMALVHEQGLDNINAEDIARQAGISRATFFRYFESKEAALVVGFYEKRLTVLVEVLASAPAELAPVDALVWTFEHLQDNLEQQAQLILLQGSAISESPSLRAKAIDFQSSYEQAVAEAMRTRFKRRQKNDPRPALLAAACMAIVRVVIARWVEAGGKGDLAASLRQALQYLRPGFKA